MDTKTAEKIVSIFKEKILTPILYAVEDEEFINLICFCDRNIKIKTFYDTSKAVEKAVGKQCDIIDIREFNEEERLQVMKDAEVLYSEGAFVEQVFAQSMHEDYQHMIKEREDMLIRYDDIRSPYLQ